MALPASRRAKESGLLLHRPVATSSAANSVVVPCRTLSHGWPSPAPGRHRRDRRGPIQDLHPGLLGHLDPRPMRISNAQLHAGGPTPAGPARGGRRETGISAASAPVRASSARSSTATRTIHTTTSTRTTTRHAIRAATVPRTHDRARRPRRHRRILHSTRGSDSRPTDDRQLRTLRSHTLGERHQGCTPQQHRASYRYPALLSSCPAVG